MNREVVLGVDEWFNFEQEMEKFPGIRHFEVVGARGCGKTYSVGQYVRKRIEKEGATVLYLRNAKRDIPGARQYFSFMLDEGDGCKIMLGHGGASRVDVCVGNGARMETKQRIGYTLALCDYEGFKSSRKHVDIIIYEEFSSFTGGDINRIFALTELLESIRQNSPNYIMINIANNVYPDDMLENLMSQDLFVRWSVRKKVNSIHAGNQLIEEYLSGGYLVPDIAIGLKPYQCLGYVQVSETKVYLFHNINLYPSVVISSKGTGKQIALDMDILKMIKTGRYRSLSDRNKTEFVIGLLSFAEKKLLIK